MKIKHLLLSACIATLGLHSGAVSAAADDTLDIEISTGITPVSATGLILRKNGIVEKKDLKVRWASDGTLIVPVPYTSADLEEGAYATAIAYASNGDQAFGVVKPIGGNAAGTSLLDLPACPAGAKGNLNSVSPDQIALLESLVRVRAQRRENSLQKVGALLGNGLQERLAKLEHGFGLKEVPPLSDKLPPAELADRLARLLAALENYELKKHGEKAEAE